MPELYHNTYEKSIYDQRKQNMNVKIIPPDPMAPGRGGAEDIYLACRGGKLSRRLLHCWIQQVFIARAANRNGAQETHPSSFYKKLDKRAWYII